MKEIWNQLLRYFFIKKGDPEEGPKNFNEKVMYWMNRIAILIFLACIITLIIRYLKR